MLPPQDNSAAVQQLALSKIPGSLSVEEQQSSIVYLDATLHPAGAVKAGAVSMQLDAPGYLLFIDAKPGANWMHACRYLLLIPSTGNTISVPGDQPPAFGPLPPSWTVLWKAPGVESWRMLPLASTPKD